MLSNFKDLMESSGASLCDPVGFGKFKGKRLWEIPETYWKTFCKKNGFEYNNLLSKIAEGKYHREKMLNRPPRRSITPEILPPDLWPHQREYLLKHGNDNYSNLWAPIGGGKTRAALELTRFKIRPGEKVLVLCLKTIFSSWVGGINDYLTPKATYITVTGHWQEKLKRLSHNRYFYFTNYETLNNDMLFDAIKKMDFSFIICDEAHKFFANSRTKTYKRAMELSASIEVKLLLTGSPRRNNDLNLFGLVSFLDRGERFGAYYSKFRERYFIPNFTKTKYSLHPGMENEFWDKVKSCSYIVPKDVLGLPPRIPKTIDIELTGEAARYYAEMKKDAIIEIENYKNTKIVAPIAIAKITKLRQLCSGFINDTGEGKTHIFNQDKIQALSELLDDIDEPVMIAVCYKVEIQEIKKLLILKDKTYGIIAGGGSDKKKEEFKKGFEDGNLDAIIVQEDAGGAGINGWQNNCSIVIRYSYSYSYDTDEQVIGRIERGGQKKSVKVLRFKTVLPNGKETIEDAIIETIKNKEEGFENLVTHLKG
jgi:superfamily II DNA or RNA helicase